MRRYLRPMNHEFKIKRGLTRRHEDKKETNQFFSLCALWLRVKIGFCFDSKTWLKIHDVSL